MKRKTAKTSPAVPDAIATEADQAAVGKTPGSIDLSNMPVEIDGKTYRMTFELGALAEAERFFKREGRQLNLMFALPELSIEGAREVFPCAVQKFHPELGWDDARALVTMKSVYPIATAIVQAMNHDSNKNAAPVE